MDIHKPKAAHSWREFLIEIGTIVCGILIALGLEQVVEAARESRFRSEAQESIEAEIGRNLDVLRRRAEVQGCIDARLRELEHLLVSTPTGGAVPRPLWVGRPQVWTISESRWTAATSGSRTALLSAERQAAYGEVYAGFRVIDQAQAIEQMAWAHMRALETLPALDAASRASLTEALHEARYANFRILIASTQTRGLAKAIGPMVERSPYESGSRSVCVPMNTPRDKALALTVPGRKPIAEP